MKLRVFCDCPHRFTSRNKNRTLQLLVSRDGWKLDVSSPISNFGSKEWEQQSKKFQEQQKQDFSYYKEKMNLHPFSWQDIYEDFHSQLLSIDIPSEYTVGELKLSLAKKLKLKLKRKYLSGLKNLFFRINDEFNIINLYRLNKSQPLEDNLRLCSLDLEEQDILLLTAHKLRQGSKIVDILDGIQRTELSVSRYFDERYESIRVDRFIRSIFSFLYRFNHIAFWIFYKIGEERYPPPKTLPIINANDFWNKMLSASINEDRLSFLFLYSDSDKELSVLIRENFMELERISMIGGNWCDLFILEKPPLDWRDAKLYWKDILKTEAYEVFSILKLLTTKPYNKSEIYEIAEKLGIPIKELPCIVLFSSDNPFEFLLIPLRNKMIEINYFRDLFESILEFVEIEARFIGIGRRRLPGFDRVKINFQEILRVLAKYDKQKEEKYKILKVLENSKFITINQSVEKMVKKYHMSGNFGVGVNEGNIQAEQVAANVNNSGSTQTLAEAAKEIQDLLQQLEKTNPTATQPQKQAFIDAAMSPTKKERLISAVQEGGKTALEEFLDNPYVNVALAVVERWRNPN
ncbi:hypothetical protein [Lusitaniella coriacea]|uniref:hypothetical protein n=1 Tax=Lusitaniella coriacea TaxID=1983105 RepID=UPI003CF89606